MSNTNVKMQLAAVGAINAITAQTDDRAEIAAILVSTVSGFIKSHTDTHEEAQAMCLAMCRLITKGIEDIENGEVLNGEN